MTEDYYRKIKTAVIFEPSGFRPVWFSLNGSKIWVETIHYKWVERRAGELIYKFTVSNENMYYELHFNNRYMQWDLIIQEF